MTPAPASTPDLRGLLKGDGVTYLSLRLHVAEWYLRRPQSNDIVPPLRPMHILQNYMEPLGTQDFGGRVGVVRVWFLERLSSNPTPGQERTES